MNKDTKGLSQNAKGWIGLVVVILFSGFFGFMCGWKFGAYRTVNFKEASRVIDRSIVKLDGVLKRYKKAREKNGKPIPKCR